MNLFFFFNLLYSVLLASAVQQHESALIMYINPFPLEPSCPLPSHTLPAILLLVPLGSGQS